MWPLLRATLSDWYEDRAQRIGAALAYYTIFALAPGLIVVMALARFLIGPGAEPQILAQFQRSTGLAFAVYCSINRKTQRSLPSAIKHIHICARFDQEPDDGLPSALNRIV